MVLGLEWLPKLEDSLLPEEELKAEKLFQHKFSMVKLESLKKSNQFKKALKEKKVHSDFFSIFAAKNFYKPKFKTDLLISFVMKKKIGNAVKRNKIRRKLKAIVQKLLKKRGAISKDYTYIVFGKSNAYAQKQSVLTLLMEKCFKKIKI
jgi:ribonuclease P protein component